MHAASIKEDSAQGCDVHYRTGSASPVSRARLIGKNAEKLEKQHTAAMCGACVFIHTQPPSQGPAIFIFATGLSFLRTMATGFILQIYKKATSGPKFKTETRHHARQFQAVLG